MDGKYKISNPEGIYFISFATVGWIDVFTRKNYRDIIVDSLNFCVEKKELILYGWVIMSNHLHLVCKAKQGNLSAILRDFKAHTAKAILAEIKTNPESRKEWMLAIFKTAGAHSTKNKEYQFWRHDNHPIEVFTNEVIDQKLEYLHNNPVKAGIVSKADDYVYSSAMDYCGMKGLVKIELMEDSRFEVVQ
jgi:putative transposase